MKTTDPSKSAAIRYESELINHFRQLIEDETELRWLVPPGQLNQNRLSVLELNLDARTFKFKPVYLLKPSIPELESILKNWTDSSPPLLIVPELAGRILEFCREKRLAAVDLNGRAYLRAESLLVDRQAYCRGLIRMCCRMLPDRLPRRIRFQQDWITRE